ncbi:MAG: metal ABC transporter substrate-binding protein [Verrucomicrobiales bacterium]
MKRLRLVLGIITSLLSASALSASDGQRLQVVSLHPLIGELAREVGGERVQVNDLLRPGDDPHWFEPSPGQMQELRTARLILASGKGMEPYLPSLRKVLSNKQSLVEIGERVPSLIVGQDSALFVCCPAHSVGGIDPHWWHSPDAMRRATRIMADALAEVDPGHRAYYLQRAQAHQQRLADLRKWAQQQLTKVPRQQRVLVTAHAAFGYFCRDFGFQSLPLVGLSGDEDPDPKHLAESYEEIKKRGIRAVFPEENANPRILENLARSTGATVGRPLLADGTGRGALATYEGMMRHNVAAIIEALAR